MWIVKITLVFLVLFAMIGAGQVAIIVHEYSHYNDYKELNVTDNQMCGLVLPTNISKWSNWSYFEEQPAGYYEFYINSSNPTIEKKYEQISSYTEVKAYIISALVFIFFMICYFIINYSMLKDKEKLITKEYESMEKDFYIQQLEKHILLQASEKQDNKDIGNT